MPEFEHFKAYSFERKVRIDNTLYLVKNVFNVKSYIKYINKDR